MFVGNGALADEPPSPLLPAAAPPPAASPPPSPVVPPPPTAPVPATVPPLASRGAVPPHAPTTIVTRAATSDPMVGARRVSEDIIEMVAFVLPPVVRLCCAGPEGHIIRHRRNR